MDEPEGPTVAKAAARLGGRRLIPGRFEQGFIDETDRAGREGHAARRDRTGQEGGAAASDDTLAHV